MTKPAVQLPHISLIITAAAGKAVDRFCQRLPKISTENRNSILKYFPLALIIIYFVFTVLYPANDFEVAKNRLLSRPDSYREHLILSEIYSKNNNYEEALKEAQIAKRINNNPETADQVEKIVEKINRPEKIRTNLKSALNITASYKNYRDIFLMISALYYVINDNVNASYYAHKAIELDPNYELSNKILGFIN